MPLDRPLITYAGDALVLDAQTRRNLELTTTQRDNKFHGSLLWALDRTLTAMGGRCLRRWLEAPLMSTYAIRKRQAVVSKLVKARTLRQALQRLLRPIGDLERLAGRADAGQAGARDLVAIADGLMRLPRVTAQLVGQLDQAPEWIQELLEIDPALIELAAIIRNHLVDNPPLSLSEGGLINDRVDPILDGLSNQLNDQDAWLATQEAIERKTAAKTIFASNITAHLVIS